MGIFERNCVQWSIHYQTVKITELLAQQTTVIHQPLLNDLRTINRIQSLPITRGPFRF